ncbi:MAG: Asp-tRNA(Asn)/Glu-tRNA(Gln) amidotransferase subunit GatB [Candidatus Paceibacterota bacterium]
MNYQPVIGLEIHIELKTRTKMFCPCLNNPEEKTPNLNICPICLGHPGTLPTINEEAVKLVLKTGLALNCEILSFSKFDRKNYFYPDLPKGYQISQYEEPLCLKGELPLFLADAEDLYQKKIKIRRIHLEEDTGKLIHFKDKKSTFIDFNRAGVPLMELVTEPVINSSKEAKIFAESLQLLLKELNISDADMEKGQMRCEANISLKKESEEKLGTKVEVKNLNSFRALERAIEFEIERQKSLLEKGEKIIQETRGWDDIKGITYSQRFKEEAQDYRYFPEPDLPPLKVFEYFDIEEIKGELKELPWQKKERLMKEYNLNLVSANLFLKEPEILGFYEETLEILKNKGITDDKVKTLAFNYLATDLLGIKEKNQLSFSDLKITPLSFSQIISLVFEDKISSRVAKDVLEEVSLNGGEPEKIIKEKNLEKVQDLKVVENTIEEVLKENPKAVEDFKKGKENALQFLIGQSMRKLKGAVDVQKLSQLLKEKLGKL